MNTISRINQTGSPLERVIDDLFNEPFFFAAPTRVLGKNFTEDNLAVDLSEDDTKYIVRANVPGFKKEEVEVAANEGVLTIKATHDESREESAERYHRRERRVASMHRAIGLPGDIVEDQTTAELKDGVLTVTLVKSPKSLPRKIAVK